jgi:uncharacterized cupin superfamily protein
MVSQDSWCLSSGAAERLIARGVGDVAVFPRGWRGPWELHETVRKVYVVF